MNQFMMRTLSFSLTVILTLCVISPIYSQTSLSAATSSLHQKSAKKKKNKADKKEQQPLVKSNKIITEARNNLLNLHITSSLDQNIKWTNALIKIRSDILTFSSTEEALHYAQYHAGLNFDHRTFCSLDFLREQKSSLTQEFPLFSDSISWIQESPFSMCCEYLNGKLVSNILYFHYRYILQCLTFVPTPTVVCQIGSGYGDVERLWLSNPIFNPNVCILIDFPECLFFAEIFLRENFQDNTNIDFIYLKNQNDLSQIKSDKKTVILCPIGNETLIKFPIDLVINTGSLQEMTNPWVDYWMSWLDETNIKYFYSLNYGACPITSRGVEVLGATTWAPRLSNKWQYLRNSGDRYLDIYSGIAEIVAVKNEPEITREKLLQTFIDCWINRKSDTQGFLDSLDVIRQLPESELIWQLLCRIFDEMSFVPRETYFLLNLFQDKASPIFLMQHSEKIGAMADYLSPFVGDLK